MKASENKAIAGIVEIVNETVMTGIKNAFEEGEFEFDLSDYDDKIAALEKKVGNVKLDEKAVEAIVKKFAGPTEIVVTRPKSRKKVKVGTQHKTFETLLRLVECGIKPYLVGPAGSGKTYAAESVAKALELKFYFSSSISSEFKLFGFMNAGGDYVRTCFREAFEKGGVFLFDEIDSSDPRAVVAFNAALENGYCDFPDGRVTQHADFRAIAAANTYGTGPDRVYVGRNPLDGASLDRFFFLEWEYDEKLEKTLANNDKWTARVQKIRKACTELKIRAIISPRASMFAGRLDGVLPDEVIEAGAIWKGIDEATKNKILSRI